MRKEIKHSWVFHRPPEEVWEYLTKPELIAQWLMETDFLPLQGHPFRFTTDSGKIIYCRVMEVNPFVRLSYSWQAHSTLENKTFDSQVMWTLVPLENGTELQLVHDGFTALEDYTGHSDGWLGLGNKLVGLLNAQKRND
jgi:uncharacterized protein YndB with AHSA1/START domain